MNLLEIKCTINDFPEPIVTIEDKRKRLEELINMSESFKDFGVKRLNDEGETDIEAFTGIQFLFGFNRTGRCFMLLNDIKNKYDVSPRFVVGELAQKLDLIAAVFAQAGKGGYLEVPKKEGQITLSTEEIEEKISETQEKSVIIMVMIVYDEALTFKNGKDIAYKFYEIERENDKFITRLRADTRVVGHSTVTNPESEDCFRKE